MATPVLELRNVTQIFRVKQGIMKRSLPLHAVSEVFMHIDKGEVLGLAGGKRVRQEHSRQNFCRPAHADRGRSAA